MRGGPYSVAVGDLNGDGWPDMAVADAGSTVSILMHTPPAPAAVGPAPAGLPSTFRLAAPRPTPSTGAVQVQLLLPSACAVDAGVYDLAGRRVGSLIAGARMGPGAHTLTWSGRDDSGVRVRGGIYMLRVRAGRDQGTRKIVVIR